MTVRAFIAHLNTRENLHDLDKEMFVVDHQGKEIGEVKTGMSTSRWTHFVIYTTEGPMTKGPGACPASWDGAHDHQP